MLVHCSLFENAVVIVCTSFFERIKCENVVRFIWNLFIFIFGKLCGLIKAGKEKVKSKSWCFGVNTLLRF